MTAALRHRWFCSVGFVLLTPGIWLLGGSSSAQESPDDKAYSTRFEIVSDAKGVDLCPSLIQGLKAVRRNWLKRIPEDARPPQRKKGVLRIEFEVLRDGSIDAMRFTGPSGDSALAQAAWDGVRASAPFPPLPAPFPDPDVTLRIYFTYNSPKPDNPRSPDAQEVDGIACKAASPGEPEVFEAGGEVSPPTAVYAPLPLYPKGPRRAQEQGAVTVGLVVAVDGSVRDVHIVEGLSPELDTAALDAVRSWRFEPATREGKPVATHVNVVVNFRLE